MEEWRVSRRMEWWEKLVYPMRRVWIRVGNRLGFRKTGLLKLRHDVRTSEYEDIHIMWEMLKRKESYIAETPEQYKKRRRHWKLFRWARCAPCICRP